MAILLSESIVSLVAVAISTLFTQVDQARKDDSDNEDVEEDESDIPSNRIVIGGIVLSSILCIVLVRYVFGSEGIESWAVLVALCAYSL